MPLFLVLITGASAAALAQPKLQPGPPGVREIELAEDGAHTVHEVKISPGLTTAFRVHGASIDRERVQVEGRERLWMSITDEAILLVPSEQFEPGERLRLIVPFQGEALPASTTLMLVVNAAMAERQVELHRKPRSAESLRAELKEKNAQLQQCREDLERLQVDVTAPRGLSGLIADSQLNGTGVVTRDLSKHCTQRPDARFQVQSITTFRAKGRVAVDLWMRSLEDSAPWLVEGVRLLGASGEDLKGLMVWQDAPGTTRTSFHIILEADAEAADARGPFSLKLWEKNGQRTITLGNVTFP